MIKRIDLLINKLKFSEHLPLQDKLPLILRRFVPETAIICDAQINQHNQPSWAIIYQDGSDTFLHVDHENKVYLEGEHAIEIVKTICAFVRQLQTYALQQAWFKQLSLNLLGQ
jgi:hypothetical protein